MLHSVKKTINQQVEILHKTIQNVLPQYIPNKWMVTNPLGRLKEEKLKSLVELKFTNAFLNVNCTKNTLAIFITWQVKYLKL